MRISDWEFRRVLFRSSGFIRESPERVSDASFSILGTGLAMQSASKPSRARLLRIRFAHSKRHKRLDSQVPASMRSEEHTSELQSLMRISYAVFCLKKKNIEPLINHTPNYTN